MRNTFLAILLTTLGVAGCVVVPAEPAVVVGPPRVHVIPPPRLVVPVRPYADRGGYHGWGYYGRGYGDRRHHDYGYRPHSRY